MEATDLERLAPEIALAVAAGLLDFEDVPEHFDIPKGDWEKFRFKPYFKKLYALAKEEWSGDVNSGKRIKLKTLAMLESSLPTLHDLAVNDKNHPSTRLDAIKQMDKMVGPSQTEQEAVNGSGFRLQINIGTERGVETITLDGGETNHSLNAPAKPGATLPPPAQPFDETDNWELQGGMANDFSER